MASADKIAEVDLTKGSLEGKHPLESTWVIWYDSRKLHQQGGPNWFENLQVVAQFNAVEDFWSTYNHVKRPNDLEYGSNYHMFKAGIKPMWEDDQNRAGGKWVITLTLKEEQQRLDDLWELLVLSMIGEYLDDGVGGDQICGAVMSRRKNGPKLSIWTREKDNEEALLGIGKRLRQILRLHDKTQLEYQSHQDALQSGSSYQNKGKLTC
eukprot:NODE_4041_length_823_cov_46.919540_g4018_i0.p1 GENE.NODE_4041_length_823_cov_46.919540_g4018_i0~~NODE_4041_length_823_cov_46.919540_g4018_i0.p1  ORF type:complete len:230 (-),score=37.52 NODE_4041_length_823_cov_46.919540_g4018_i0:133-759(-)